MAVHRHENGCPEAGLVGGDAHAELATAFRFVVIARSQNPLHPVHHGPEVHLVAGGLGAEAFGAANEARDVGAHCRGLRWDAPAVEAVASELVPLDQGGPRGRDRPRGTVTYDLQIVVRR